MGRPTKNQSRDVRALLLAEAARVVAESGEQAVRTKAIASAVGVTEPALFHYFGSREGLIEEVQAYRFETTQVDLNVKFRNAVLDCSTKAEFAAVVVASLEEAFSMRRMPNREARASIVGSAVSRPQLKERIVAAQGRAVGPIIDAMTYAREREWTKPDLDSEAFAYWIVGQTNARYFAEIRGDERLLAALTNVTIRAALVELGLDSEALDASRSKKKRR